MSDLMLSSDDIEALTGYATATKQLQVLHNRGFHRAFINHRGVLVIERSHYEAVTRGETQPTVGTKVANLSILRPQARSMIRSREKPDGLRYRVYERYGKHRYSIGHKMTSGRWAFRFDCAVEDVAQIKALRRKAIEESARVIADRPQGGFKGLVTAWFEWQEALPVSDARKSADSTIAENKREAENLNKAWATSNCMRSPSPWATSTSKPACWPAGPRRATRRCRLRA
jgi:hypothetical protein